MRRDLRIFRDWGFLFAYLVVIVGILPFTGQLAHSLIKKDPFYAFIISLSVHLVLLIIAVSFALYVLIANKGYKILRLIALIIIFYTALYGLSNIKEPSDQLHIIEYGMLAFFLFRVLRFYNPTTAVYLWCMVFLGIAGLADEYIQSFMPSRGFSMEDLKIDMFVGALAELSIAFVIWPRLERWRTRMSFLKKSLSRQEKWLEDYKAGRQDTYGQ